MHPLLFSNALQKLLSGIIGSKPCPPCGYNSGENALDTIFDPVVSTAPFEKKAGHSLRGHLIEHSEFDYEDSASDRTSQETI